MTNSKRNPSVDEVLADYVNASQDFDAQVLQAYVDKYPDHAGALRRYAQVQLTSVPACAEEVEDETLSDDELLPLQSKLLQRMQELRGKPTASDAQEVIRKLGSISGETATRAATVAVFGACQHGEELLLLCVTEPTPGVEDIPEWVYENLGSYIEMPAAVVQAGIAMKHQAARQHRFGSQQRFSSKEKPAETSPMRWEQAVEVCISDEQTKRTILEKSKNG